MKNEAKTPRWYVFYTASRAEKVAEKRLKDMGAEVFLPIHREKRKWSDRIKVIEAPLFRSYIFIRCIESKLRTYVTAEGVVRTLYYCGKPAVVRDEEIEEIRKFLEMTHEQQIISEGDMVNILGGPFEKKVGKVTHIDKKYIYLTIESLEMMTICAEIRIDKDLVSK